MSQPLAFRIRPKDIDLMVGHDHLLQKGRPFRIALESDTVGSVIFWGPPGCGKTTIAEWIAVHSTKTPARISAVTDGMPALRKILGKTSDSKTGILLFVDEIHRWNKAQQDALLPHVESGHIQLIGATTENPYFSIIPALRSRTWIIEMKSLSDESLEKLLDRGAQELKISLKAKLQKRIAQFSSGDARRALTFLERIHLLSNGGEITSTIVDTALNRKDLMHDKNGDAHYDVVSAFIKSMRGSDPDAALYWLARLIEGGEDPVYIARRMVIFASEDIGNADLRALPLAVSTMQGAAMIGYPEARILLGQCCSYLSSAPKSNAAYMGIKAALKDIHFHGALSPPPNIKNKPINYMYPHDHPLGLVDQPHWPVEMKPQKYYRPKAVGDEKIIMKRLEWWAQKLENRPRDKKDD